MKALMKGCCTLSSVVPLYVLFTISASADPLEGPKSVSEELKPGDSIAAPQFRTRLFKDSFSSWYAFKERLQEEYNLNLGFDYTLVGGLTDSDLGLGEAVGHDLRFYGTWTPVNQGGMNSGSLTFKVESRDAYTRIPPQDLGINAGAMSITSAQFSDAGLILTNLYWKQRFMDDRLTIGFGQMDVTDYSDIYPLANPVSAFQNLAFSVSPSIPFPSQGLALAAGFWFSDNVYSIAGIADANGDPSSPDFDVFDTGETFQHVEVGITSSRERQYLDNFHVTLWNQDARKMQGIPEDRGVSVSTNWVINDSFVPFLRAGWSDKGTALHQKSVSTGIGYLTPWHDLLGMGFNWGSAAGLNEQWTMEAFYRYQVSESLALTFDVQQVWNPALNPDQDRIGFYNMRLRLAF